jgi:hypothetical protein
MILEIYLFFKIKDRPFFQVFRHLDTIPPVQLQNVVLV